VAVAIKSLLQPSSFFSIRNNVNPLLNPPPQTGSQYVSSQDSSSSAVECWTIGVCSECSKLGAAAVHDHSQNTPPRPTRDDIDFGGGNAVAVGGDDGGNGGEGGMPPQEKPSTTELAAMDGFGMQEPSPKELAVMEKTIAHQAAAAFAAAEIEMQQQQQRDDQEVVNFKQELHNKAAPSRAIKKHQKGSKRSKSTTPPRLSATESPQQKKRGMTMPNLAKVQCRPSSADIIKELLNTWQQSLVEHEAGTTAAEARVIDAESRAKRNEAAARALKYKLRANREEAAASTALALAAEVQAVTEAEAVATEARAATARANAATRALKYKMKANMTAAPPTIKLNVQSGIATPTRPRNRPRSHTIIGHSSSISLAFGKGISEHKSASPTKSACNPMSPTPMKTSSSQDLNRTYTAPAPKRNPNNPAEEKVIAPTSNLPVVRVHPTVYFFENSEVGDIPLLKTTTVPDLNRTYNVPVSALMEMKPAPDHPCLTPAINCKPPANPMEETVEWVMMENNSLFSQNSRFTSL
jgi:hypothetical protein